MPSQQNFIRMLSRLLHLPPTMLTSDTRLREDLGLVEWEMVWLINQLERRYQIEINDNNFSSLSTLRNLELMLKRKNNNLLESQHRKKNKEKPELVQ
ncbi:MAG: acyl carrier protein [Chitinophagaceae bacterium]|jgi:acyl carrier protein|nr:acyl carrier protein [Chitinophagaceae bacterium]MCA6469951.1 acyl carrier protein [Chitinophagaceae bacterium]MCA6477656.1 acyl carrier protein [Chitinophagaceae bacterium]MCA6498414.1 acyl carrier protein [Chitinophagaceae bacterium]